MKKVGLIILTLVVLIVGVSGFMFINNSKAEESPAKQNKQVSTNKKEVKTEQKAPEKAYKIDKITVAIDTGLLSNMPEFKPLQDFNLALLNEIAKENNITIETKDIPTWNDVRLSLSRKETDVQILSFAEVEPDLTMSYSFITYTVINDKKEALQPERDYTFILHQDNVELGKLLNDYIVKYKENGKLEQLKQQYLGQ
jgi:ABC-type amino acid transport substrate-binding protein